MKRLTKEKRDQLILVFIVILMVLAGLWFILIRAQKAHLQSLREQKAANESLSIQVRDRIKNSRNLDAELNDVTSNLAEREKDMAAGDLYASLLTTIRKFKMRYKLEIPQFSPASSATDIDLMPKFPYKQIKISISGTGYYDEIGTFITDFENEYSASRIVNLELVPSVVPGIDSKEKLTFKMDVISLVASGAAMSANSQ